jgi:hypothetical protein
MKSWKYGTLKADFYICRNCGAKIREYTRDGKHSFTLMFRNGKYRKAYLIPTPS